MPRARSGDKNKIVAHVVGARPNYMKVAPVHRALARYGGITQLLIHTGQHYDRELNELFFVDGLLPRPDVNLGVGSGSHTEQITRALTRFERAFADPQPDLVVVVGDVNSTLAAALAAVRVQLPVCHVEAGLRSFERDLPEEHNRRVTDHVATLLLTHSESANENLAAEGLGDRVSFVGNTLIDTLFAHVARARELLVCRRYGLAPGAYVLVTLHRRALVDDRDLLAATAAELDRLAGRIGVVFPVHPRTRSRLESIGVAGSRVLFTPALGYVDFLSLQATAAAVITDSGGVQEEATALSVPCFTLRATTERPVTVTHGTNTVLGLDPAALADIPARLKRPREELPPLWDGRAGERSALAIADLLGLTAEPASVATAALV
jgi:UDP-N-acetylglucosamine 2-epimerase (non-hydrolysing)